MVVEFYNDRHVSNTSDIVGFDYDCLRQQIRLHSLISKILPDAGILIPSERCGSLLVIIAVHIDCARMQPLDKFDGPIDIGSDHSCPQSIREGVGPVYHVFLFTPFQYAHHWAEYLLLCDSHMVLYVGEDGGFDEIPFFSQPASSSHHLGSLLHSLPDVVENAIELLLADNGSQLSILIHRVSHFQTLCVLNASLYEFVVD